MCENFDLSDSFDSYLVSVKASFKNSYHVSSHLNHIKDIKPVDTSHVIFDAQEDLNNISVDDSIFVNENSQLIASNGCDNKSIGNSTQSNLNLKEDGNQINSYAAPTNRKPDFAKDLCKLVSWGLPETILQKYANHNIVDMFPWQVECLSRPSVLSNSSNLVYSAPTSSGKTLVSEILAIKTLLERHKKVIFILPFISVVYEKMYYFQDILNSSGIRVEGFMGSHHPPGGFKAVNLAVCTIEKANSIVNKLLEEGALSEIGTLIVDELHLIGDSSRGYLLELLLTKLQYMSKKSDDINIQIVGMSATLPNLHLLAKWLDAELFTTDYRPIPLFEQCLVNGELYNNDLKLVRRLTPLPELTTDSDNIVQLCLETISESCSVLIFCPTKNWCENLAQQIAVAFWKLGSGKSAAGLTLRQQLKFESILELLEQLKRCPVGLDSILQKTVSFGVAFHHAGLTMDERDIIEGAFRNGSLRVLVATSTLSSGVNLPARRVIIRTLQFYGRSIDSLVYRQMIGRAGRMGKDTCGESILICQKSDYAATKELMSARLQPIESCLEGSGKLKRAILEIVASNVATSPDDLGLFTKCTLLAASEDERENYSDPITEAVNFLCKNEFIRLQEQDDGSLKYLATSLAKACLSSSMPPEEGLLLFAELDKARQCFVLETELHLVYLVTPYNACNQIGNIDWMLYLDMFEKLPASMKRVANLVGVQESYIVSSTRGTLQSSTSRAHHKLMIHKRFYTALALQDLVNEIPLNQVATKFNCNRGMLQSLQQTASTFAGMLTAFSRQLGWSSIELLISQFQDRLHFGVNRELLDLMRLPLLNGPRARALYNGGIETLVNLASSDVNAIENILHKIAPFESGKERDDETASDAQKRTKIRGIWITGKEGLTERDAAVLLIETARKYLQYEMGLSEVKWESQNKDKCDTDPGVSLENDKNINDNPEMQGLIDEHKSSSLNGSNHKSDYNSGNFSQTARNNESSFILIKPIAKNHNATTTEEPIEKRTNSMRKVSSAISINLFLSECSNSSHPITQNLDQKSTSDSINVKEICDIGLTESMANDFFNTSEQSLFEASFEQKCSISQDKQVKCNRVPCDNSIQNITSTNVVLNKLSDSGLEIESGSFFENMFSSSFNSMSISTPKEIATKLTQEKNNSSDCIGNSQDENSIIRSFTSQEKRKHRKKSKKRNRNKENDSLNGNADVPSNGQTPKIKKKKVLAISDSSNTYGSPLIKFNQSDIQLLTSNKETSNDSISLTKLEVVNVCNDLKLFEVFSDELLRKQCISLSLACIKIPEQKPIIGPNSLRNTINDNNSNVPQTFLFKHRKLEGIVVCWGNNVSYYISLLDEAGPISADTKINLLRQLFKNSHLKVRVFDSKEQVKVLKLCCGVDFYSQIDDPKVADWILLPEGKEKTLLAMAVTYAPETVGLARLAGHCRGVGSNGLDLHSSIDPKVRGCVEAIVTWHLSEALHVYLREQNTKLLQTYDVEMRSMLSLARMEICGFGVDKPEFEELSDNLRNQANNLQEQAYSLAGRRFSLLSSSDVAKALGIYKGRKLSMNKQALLRQKNPIAQIVLQWRKINTSLTNMVLPLIRSIENGRIHGCCVTHNSTGRISMHEPNLQTVPKDFEIVDPLSKTKTFISFRKVFVPKDGYVFVSADYCQLELRLLACLSEDSLLCSIMRSGEDVFRTIAALWKNIGQTEVDDVIRQWAKQICYGIIYGMGAKALSTQLSVTEDEAAQFIESFLNKYPMIKSYISATIQKCEELGYVETITGRRRYLPDINSDNLATKSQARRKAVNTTIQGSAADIAKAAMVEIDRQFLRIFDSHKRKINLVLHLHDELLYEVPAKHLTKAALTIKRSMEGIVNLGIPFPVKVKSGTSWGSLEELLL